jgi:hypothetical protein
MGLDGDGTAELIAMGVLGFYTEWALVARLFCCFNVECRAEECRGPAHHPELGSLKGALGAAKGPRMGALLLTLDDVLWMMEEMLLRSRALC